MYIDPIERAIDNYLEDMEGEWCPMCGGTGLIPDEECVDDCECTECEGTGQVSHLHARQIRKQINQKDYGD